MKRNITLVFLASFVALTGAVGYYTFSRYSAASSDVILSSDVQKYDKEQYDWHLLLVNASHAIPDDYEVTLSELSNGVLVDERIYPDLQQMFDDMRADGLSPVVGEGYRTHQAQENMMADKVNMYIEQGYSKKDADKQARKWVAEPGTSEHELGLALDINAVDSTDAWDVYTWLADNAYKYGFILRYPSGKEEITGIDYEPWHYRYVGKEAALNIYQQDVTLEEYLEGH